MVSVGYTPLPHCFAQSIQSMAHKSGLLVRTGRKVLFSKNYCCKVFEIRYLACLSWLGREFGFGVAPCFYYRGYVKGFGWVGGGRQGQKQRHKPSGKNMRSPTVGRSGALRMGHPGVCGWVDENRQQQKRNTGVSPLRRQVRRLRSR
jgi:hypothetical protein